MARVVLALGGNALGNTPSEQLEAVKIAAKAIVELQSKGNEVIICHGNGPQVGMINNVFSSALSKSEIQEVMPFAECGAMSQGYIGFHLQNAINNEVSAKGSNAKVATIVTQTLVDKADPAFKDPTKPIGPFMSEDEAKSLAKDNNWTVKEDSGRGWRRVVPSPKPMDIVEKDGVNALLSAGFIVIAGGGGGVPVYKDGNNLMGIDSVIDKDFTSAKLAELTGADAFIVLTAVPRVMVNFGQADQEAIAEANTEDLLKHIEDEQFAPGSMLPKVQAAMSFAQATGKAAFIGELQDAQDIITGKTGTKIVK